MQPNPDASTPIRPLAPLALIALCLVVVVALATGPVVGKAKEKSAPGELAQKYRDFLQTVDLIMTEQEREAFLELESDYERDEFIERFWRSRDPQPQTTRNEFKDRWDRRIEYVNRFLDEEVGERDERRRMILLNGPPGAIVESKCSNLLVPIEVWIWARSEALGHELAIVFYKPGGGALPFRIWHPLDGLDALFDRWGSATAQPSLQTIALRCPEGEKLAGAIGWVLREGNLGFSTLLGRIEEGYDPPSSEWVETFESYSTRVPEGAETFDAGLEITYPGRRQSRTVAQGLISVPVSAVGTAELAGSRSYNLVLNGEVLLDGVLFETFRYKFDFPASQIRESTIPLVFERALRPGEQYTLVLKVEDLNSGRFHRAERTLDVPAVEQRMRAPGPRDEETVRLLDEANAILAEGESSLRLVRPQGELLTDMIRFNTLAVGEGFDHVTFALDGRPVLIDKKPPYSVELDLGTLPRTHSLRATAYDAEGVELASDEILVNTGGTRFRVHLTEPRRGRTYEESLRVAAELEVPAGKDVDRMEIYVNETRVATLYDPPWAQPVVLPEEMRGGGVIGYVRAVAYLEDGNATEDTVFINAPDYIEEVDVQFVELYATVLDRSGRPVDGLGREDFRVFEEGAEQQILRFEQVRDQPIHTAILMDVSASMSDRLDATREAAVQYYRQIVRPKDRASLITFNDYPNLAVKFTNGVDELAGGLAGLKAERGTSLWDSVIFSLYYFNGVKGQKALIILSDGEDESSRFGFDAALEYARRAGVTVYTIGLSLPRGQARRQLTRLAEETGGRSYFIDSTAPLTGIYNQVENELRSQYLVAYQSAS
ncbi:MAG: VWA domain-containing protein, partial [Acidobacteriota bacterium]